MKNENAPVSEPALVSDYHPDRVRFLLSAIKRELELSQGRTIPFQELAGYAGQAASSVFDKLQRARQPQVESLLCWLERLPEAARARVVNAACRDYPSIENPRLRHDPAQVSQLKSLLRQSHGFTLVQGGNDSLRTFLVTALGHSRGLIVPQRPGALGLDSHTPDWFVPLEQVIYLNNLLDPGRLRGCVHQHWPTLSRTRDQLVILNRVWLGAQGLEKEIAALGKRSHVILADDPGFKLENLAREAPAPRHVLGVAEEKDQRIRITFQQL